MPRHDASGDLLDAAERLIATHGIHKVSDRRIADAAGNSNHSAVGYYFGGRAGLIQALLTRHHQAMVGYRRSLFDESDSLIGDVRALVLPTTMVLAELPAPTWRARFLTQAYHDPRTVRALEESDDDPFRANDVYESVTSRLVALDPVVVSARADLMTHLVSSTCAYAEAQADRSGSPAPWAATGRFLCDAIAGMLQAPISDH